MPALCRTLAELLSQCPRNCAYACSPAAVDKHSVSRGVGGGVDNPTWPRALAADSPSLLVTLFLPCAAPCSCLLRSAGALGSDRPVVVGQFLGPLRGVLE